MSKRATPLLIVTLAFLAFFSLGLPDGLLGVAWPSIRTTFGLPLDALGLLATFTTAGYLISSFSSGRVLRVLPIGPVLTLSTAAAAIALLSYALTPSWSLMVALGFLAGLGGGAIDAGLNAYSATHFSARILNWLHAFFGLGTTVGPLITTAVLSAGLVWRWSYAIVGVAQLLLAITFLLTRRRWLEVHHLVETASTPLTPARTRDTLRQPIVWLGMLLFFVYTGVEFVPAQWSYSVLTLSRGVPDATAGIFVSLYGASLMIGRILFGFIADHVPLKSALRICMIATVVGALLFWLEPTQGLSLAGLMLIGFSIAPIFASLISLTPGRVGLEHAGSTIGFLTASAWFGGAAAVGLAGVLARDSSLEVVGPFVLVLALLMFALYECFLRVGESGKS